MEDTTELNRVVAAIETLDWQDKNIFLSALYGMVKLDSPQSIIDAAKWTSVADKIQEALDKLD